MFAYYLSHMTIFILNDKLVRTDLPKGASLLDYIRYGQGLTGTKIGCREGDCGACTVLEGTLIAHESSVEAISGNTEHSLANPTTDIVQSAETEPAGTPHIHYRAVVSCLTPLGNAHGKHIVTIEGLNMEVLSPVQQVFVDHNGTQCGFCTPGFVVSLTGHALSSAPSAATSAIASMDGNICRCTGYKSIERAAISISRLLKDKSPDDPLGWLVREGFLPRYFLTISAQMHDLAEELTAQPGLHAQDDLAGPGKESVLKQSSHTDDSDNSADGTSAAFQIVGGGTDLMVQRPDELADEDPVLVFDRQALKGIRREKNSIFVGAAATASDLMCSKVMSALIPGIKDHFNLVSSDPIRNMGTLGGNLVNASPIGDLSIYFLAWDALLELEECKTKKTRTVALKDFFLDYKRLDLLKNEMVVKLSLKLPENPFLFNFEKVSKRTHLDIASVNAAIYLETEQDLIKTCRISCGGVAPVPLFLRETSAFLSGKSITADTLKEANEVLQKEITPISDVRGSVDYKRLLARQLLYAHFLKLFPERITLDELLKL